jgi:alpha-tubulin suppressor-like RCC1 family protein
MKLPRALHGALFGCVLGLAGCGGEPTSASGSPDFSVVSAGGFHTCAVTGGGELYCWGDNLSGQYGNGTTEESAVPTLVTGLTLSSVHSGRYHTCGLQPGGGVVCWGYNFFGQLGNRSVQGSLTPVEIASTRSFVAATAGNYHNCALTGDGELLCWGDNASGQVGTNDPLEQCAAVVQACQSSPTVVVGGFRYTAVSAGASHTCAIRVGGELYCWGSNLQGQLGDGTTTSRVEPKKVLSELRFTSVSAGAAHTCAVAEDGTAWCWGLNNFGQLGNGTWDSFAPTPVPVRVATSLALRIVGAGQYHTCGVTTTNAALCWGNNYHGELGDADSSSACIVNPLTEEPLLCSTTPVTVAGGLSIESLSAGPFHTCAVARDGTAWCWGRGRDGELGDGAYEDRRAPTRVFLPS